MCTRSTLLLFFRSMMAPRSTLATEILALRQQPAVLNRSIKRPQLDRRDQFFRVTPSRPRKNRLEGIINVKAETVVKWRKEGSRLYWRWKSKPPVGLPQIDKKIRVLIQRMSHENPLWGAPRIQSGLGHLGFDCFVTLLHARRRVVHFNGAGRPAGERTARQIIEAFSDNEVPRHLS